MKICDKTFNNSPNMLECHILVNFPKGKKGNKEEKEGGRKKGRRKEGNKEGKEGQRGERGGDLLLFYMVRMLKHLGKILNKHITIFIEIRVKKFIIIKKC